MDGREIGVYGCGGCAASSARRPGSRSQSLFVLSRYLRYRRLCHRCCLLNRRRRRRRHGRRRRRRRMFRRRVGRPQLLVCQLESLQAAHCLGQTRIRRARYHRYAQLLPCHARGGAPAT